MIVHTSILIRYCIYDILNIYILIIHIIWLILFLQVCVQGSRNLASSRASQQLGDPETRHWIVIAAASLKKKNFVQHSDS